MNQTGKEGGISVEQTVYVDLLFLINFSMDFLCLFLTSRLLSRRLSLPRALLSATLGGIYAVTELIALPDNIAGVFLDLAFCVLMCFLAFFSKGERLTSLLIVSVSYILASALLGGIMTACFSLLNRYSPPISQESAQMPVWIFCLVTILSALATLLGGRHLKKRASTSCAIVEIVFDGCSVKLRAMCDSGNLLRDSISGRPVLVADAQAASALFREKHLPIPSWSAESLPSFPSTLAERVRLIPIHSVGGDRLMVALRPDKLFLHDENGSHAADALVGFTDLHCAPRDCQALIPSDLLA